MNKDYGTNKSEQRIAKQIGARAHKNSGRGAVKGDATWANFVVDIKESKSFTLNDNVWAKICTDALTHMDKDPALLIVLPNNVRLAVIEWEMLEDLVEHYRTDQ